MRLFQIRTRPDLQSEWADYQRVIAKDEQDAMRLATVPDFTLLTAVEVTEPGFHLEIKLGNAAMKDTFDVGHALKAVSRDLVEHGLESGKIYDDNGNEVGSYSLVLPEPPTEEVSAINVQAGQRIKIGDSFERVEQDAAIMPGDRVEIITEPYSEGVLWESDRQVEVLIEEEGR